MTVTDRTAATDAEFRSRIAPFESAVTPPEVREARVVEEVARAMADVLWEREEPLLILIGLVQPDRTAWEAAAILDLRCLAAAAVAGYRAQDGGAEAFAAAVLRAAAQEQRNEAERVPDTDEGTHADGHRCAADFLDRRAAALDPR